MNRIYLDTVRKHGNIGYDLNDQYDNEVQFLEGTPEDDLELLAFVVENCGEAGCSILQFSVEEQRGIDINNVWYDYEKIKDILDKLK
jgi:hypothetical protein